MNYVYSALGSDELRVLKPLRGRTPEDLCFNIRHVPRSRAPPYTAVSYACGDGKATETIHINGKPFLVRLNLWSCLYFLTRPVRRAISPREHVMDASPVRLIPLDWPFREVRWTHIWVDAICIDQNNDAERSIQVRSMNLTYSLAHTVSIWLGLVPAAPSALDSQSKTFDDERLDWRASIENIMKRPYWHRLWVVQEFRLGRNIEFCCSGNRIGWELFHDFLIKKFGNLYGSLAASYGPDPYDKLASGGISNLAAIPLFVARESDDHTPWERSEALHHLLVRHRDARCKDPRDRVFALLSLVDPEEQAALSQFFPDYSLSHERVVVITLAHLIRHPVKRIGEDSNGLFQGLGVTSPQEIRRLLELAKKFNYTDVRDIAAEEKERPTERLKERSFLADIQLSIQCVLLLYFLSVWYSERE